MCGLSNEEKKEVKVRYKVRMITYAGEIVVNIDKSEQLHSDC